MGAGREKNGSDERGCVMRSFLKNDEQLTWLRMHVFYSGADCLYWPFARDRNGYCGLIEAKGTMYIYGKIRAHRLMCTIVNGAPPTSKHHAAHSCHNGHMGCIHPKHLHWATPAENGAERAALHKMMDFVPLPSLGPRPTLSQIKSTS
jgi:hypothetical protein